MRPKLIISLFKSMLTLYFPFSEIMSRFENLLFLAVKKNLTCPICKKTVSLERYRLHDANKIDKDYNNPSHTRPSSE